MYHAQVAAEKVVAEGRDKLHDYVNPTRRLGTSKLLLAALTPLHTTGLGLTNAPKEHGRMSFGGHLELPVARMSEDHRKTVLRKPLPLRCAK
jgi:hypothetical protein